MPRPHYARTLQNFVSKSIYAFYHSRWMPGRAAINRTASWVLDERVKFSELPTETKSKQILKALQTQVAYCRKFVPYYREILHDMPDEFPRDFVEYRQFPILTKEILRQAGDALLSEEFSKSTLRRHATGGSTGEPVVVYMTPVEDALGGYEYFMRQNGVGTGTRLATLYGGELDVSASPSRSRRVKDWLLNVNNHGCFRLDNEYLLEVHHEFENFQPDVLVGYASAIYLLARTLITHKIKPSYPRKVTITAAEKLEQHQREVVESVFITPVIERYGSREVGTIGEQRPGDRRIWLDSWDYLVEPETLVGDYHPASLVFSRLHTRAMPLLRYQIGDLGVFPQGWRPEDPALYLEEVRGRTLDWIYLPGGRRVHGSEFPHLFKDFDIILYQVVQEVDGKVSVSIVPASGFDKSQQTKCEQIIRSNLSGAPVQFCYEKEIVRTAQQKLRPVISYCSPL